MTFLTVIVQVMIYVGTCKKKSCKGKLKLALFRLLLKKIINAKINIKRKKKLKNTTNLKTQFLFKQFCKS